MAASQLADEPIMSDAAAISQFTQSHLADAVHTKVAVKAKEVAQQQGDAVLSLLQTAAELTPCNTGDCGKGTGGKLDVIA